jgi:hypothetical protein
MTEKHSRHSFNTAAGKDHLPLLKLKPTQMTIGMEEVSEKRKYLQKLAKHPAELSEYLEEHPARIVLGPGGNAYIIDRHHLTLALIAEGYKKVLIKVEQDFSASTDEAFWRKMRDMNLVHPYDENGKEVPLTSLPENLKDLKDDPYRSLAGLTRIAGGFEKVPTPYAEFLWADYFRSRIDKKLVTDSFHDAMDIAAKLCKDPAAKALPGYKPETSHKTRDRKHGA